MFSPFSMIFSLYNLKFIPLNLLQNQTTQTPKNKKYYNESPHTLSLGQLVHTLLIF